MAYSDIVFKDNRTGRFRKAAPYERNKYFKIDTLSKGIASFAFKTADGMGEVANDLADALVEYARTHAPWEDRTGEAREGLEAAVTLENHSLEVDLYHTVDYGIWLEVRWGGKYAIIIPTIEAIGPKLLAGFDHLLSEIVYYD